MTFKKSLGLQSEFLVVHSGNIGVKQGLDVMLEAAHLSRGDNSLQYLIVGDGAARERLQAKAKAMELTNLRILPLLPDHQYQEMLMVSDVSLITQQKCVADIVFPSKVITLMAAGQAIVAGVSPGSEVATVLNKARAGLVVPAEDPAGLLSAVTMLRDNHSLRHELAHNARQFAKQTWDREIILASLESRLRTLIEVRETYTIRRRRFWNLSKQRYGRSGNVDQSGRPAIDLAKPAKEDASPL